MSRFILASCLLSIQVILAAQTTDTTVTQRKNSAQTLIDSKGGNLLMAAYGEVHFNQPFSSTTRYNGSLDVHRQVLLFGYRFNRKTTFITEIEIEHIKEVFLEQAFLNYQAKPWLNVQAGLLLIPMGIVNEYHEPTTFNGVERPEIDNVLIPTTWRELGAGIAGNLPNAGLRYQAYLVNGPLGYDEEGQLSGQKPIRGARQKGSQVSMTAPDFAGRLTYYGIKGLDVGLSFYAGKTESNLYNNLPKEDANALASADSSVVGFQMAGIDFRLQRKAFESRGQLIYSTMSNVNQYNAFADADLGTSAIGAYAEVGYNIGSFWDGKKLTPFLRYSWYDTHHQIPETMQSWNMAYWNTVVTTGLSYFIHPSFVVKADYQRFEDAAGSVNHRVNSGIGYWFR